MSSIGEDYNIIGVLLDNDGVYPDDPQALQLSRYDNNWGGKTFHVAMNKRQVDSLNQSPYCRNVQILWRRESGITFYGQEILNEYKKKCQNKE